ncbi:DUF551 domain-containing protein [Klebsiella grimontii]|uniref:DUF551 domain-containing protein n=1 Tax=Klebsiella grimontii TaxID=2058152 RepID=UPI001D0DF944|nr:DUF551 domain-containing protein [Klebsiella grimontii]
MTSKLTREQATDSELQMLIDSHEKGTAMFLRVDAYYLMAKELQERRKADSEPMGYFGRFDPDDEDLIDQCSKNVKGAFPLYRHAQQPEVPPEMTAGKAVHHWSGGHGTIESFVAGCNFYRAAMLQAGNSPVIPEGWQVEAEKLAEMHGMSFVLFRHGEAPQCADPTKVVISFTDKGLGHDTPPAATAGIPMIPDGYVMVPKGLLSELRDWAHPEIEKYCEMWEGRRDSEFPALRKVIADADALLAAAPQPQSAPQNIPEIIPGWIPVSERLPEKNQSVLISVNFDSSLVDPLICTARYTGTTFRRGEATVKPGSGIEEVTHWMPLPAGPKEEK